MTILTWDVGLGLTQLNDRWTMVFGGITIGNKVQGPTGIVALPHFSVVPLDSCHEMPFQGWVFKYSELKLIV